MAILVLAAGVCINERANERASEGPGLAARGEKWPRDVSALSQRQGQGIICAQWNQQTNRATAGTNWIICVVGFVIARENIW